MVKSFAKAFCLARPLRARVDNRSVFCTGRVQLVSSAQTVSSKTNMSPQISEADKTRMEMEDWLQMPAIQTSAVIGKNTDGSDITQDVDVLVWWRDVGQARFPHIAVMTRQSLHSLNNSFLV